ncbi:MAG: FMN-binding protein [Kineosporiaceae bacterium]
MRRPAVVAMGSLSLTVLAAAYHLGDVADAGAPRPDLGAAAATLPPQDTATSEPSTTQPQPSTTDPQPSTTAASVSPVPSATSASPATTTATVTTTTTRGTVVTTRTYARPTTARPTPTTAPPRTTSRPTTAPATTPPPTTTSTPPKGTPKTYTGDKVTTGWGPVQVRITVVDGVITGVTALKHPKGNDTSVSINEYALPLLEQQVLAAQSASIDGVSGATVTSGGYRTSLQSALDLMQK